MRPAWQLVDELAAMVRPALKRHDDVDTVEAQLARLRTEGSGAERQRRVYRRHGSLQAVLAYLAAWSCEAPGIAGDRSPREVVILAKRTPADGRAGRTMTAGLTTNEADALAAVDEAEIARLLLELLAVPSITGSAAESEMQHLLARRLDRLGMEVDLWAMDLPALRADTAFPGSEAPRDEAWGLTALTPGGEDGPVLILQGHVDVVPPGDPAKWQGDPFVPRVVGDVVHARGACDMKAGLVANLAAVAAIRASGAKLRGRIAAHFAVSEEDGGLGAFGTLRRGHTGDACIITEPTSGNLITANAGALTFRIEVAGKATHASTRDAGTSAIDAYLPIHAALARLEARRNTAADPLMRDHPIPYSLSVGKLAAGDWASSVPDLLVAEGRLGVQLDEDPAHARAALETCIAEAADADPWLREHPPAVTWPGGQFASGRLAPGDPLRELVLKAHHDAVGGPQPPERGAPYGSDLRLYTGAGIPTLHFGPGDVRHAHGPHEQVRVSDIVAVTRLLVLATLRAVGVS